MPSAFAISVIYSILTVVIAGAWVAGYLDKYQKMAQNVLLGAMGENRMSYGLKSEHSSEMIDSCPGSNPPTQARSKVSKSTIRVFKICRAASRMEQAIWSRRVE
ncbi:hypothetical protein MMC10_008799 [Thelotrema lepadinum]|nr:hypothetical protein [Thelotrema lepadinum]